MNNDQLNKAVDLIRRLKLEIDDLRKTDEPIAIIGMACRFPHGASNLEKFWAKLENGEDLVTEIPSERWNKDEFYSDDPDAENTMYTKNAAFLSEDISLFDASFFNISPKEAQMMDPQQRLLLEVVWESLEDAGIPPSSLKDRQVGFFLGQMNTDYAQLISENNQTNAYVGSGNAPSATAGRVSYILGLQGPCIAIDTACSSSLVALNSAVQSIREGESEVGIVAGVNLILSPKPMILFCQAKMLSLEGHCKTFDASADGYTRGEGCGVLVLKPVSKAMRDGNKIWAIIRGSAVNQDGASSGLTVPNATAQERLIKFTLAKAGLKPEDIDYIEVHGTGTSLGDPIEIRGLTAVFGDRKNKSEKPLIMSSVKTYLGHLESAAGVVGVIKTVLSMNHNWIPKHLHLKTLNPAIDLEGLNAEIPLEGRQWPVTREPKRAGVSSFGFSGINAHVILEEAPQDYVPQTQPLPATIFNRQRYWIETKVKHAVPSQTETALILQAETIPEYGWLFKAEIDTKIDSYLNDHVILNHILFPGAGFVELCLEAIKAMDEHKTIKELIVERPLQLDKAKNIKIILQNEQLRILDDENTYVQATLKPAKTELITIENTNALLNRCDNEIDVEYFYSVLYSYGFMYGFAFQGLKNIKTGANCVYAELKHFENQKGYQCHPTELDSALHMLIALDMEKDAVYLPWQFGEVEFNANAGDIVSAFAEFTKQNDKEILADIKLLDNVGRVKLSIKNFQARKAEKSQIESLLAPTEHYLAYSDWVPIQTFEEQPLSGQWQIVGDDSELAVVLEAGGVSSYNSTLNDFEFNPEQKPDGIIFNLTKVQFASIALVNPLKALLQYQELPRIILLMDDSCQNGDLLGFVKTLILEYPTAPLQLIELNNSADLIHALQIKNEPLLAVLNKQMYVWRISPTQLETESKTEVRTGLTTNAHLLITGALGGLGQSVTRWLSEQGVGRISLVGRNKPDVEYHQKLKKLSSEIQFYECDISDAKQTQELVQKLNTIKPLTGIFHLAGVLEDGIFANQTKELFEKVFAGKAKGAWNLHKATKEIPLDYFVLFSSVASSMGSPGQTNYASANSFLDTLALYRRKQGLAALSIQWGPWANEGMATSLAAEHKRKGFKPFNEISALQALARCLEQSSTVIQVANINSKQLANYAGEVVWLEKLIHKKSEINHGYLLSLLQQTNEPGREKLLHAELERFLRQVLNIPATQIISESQGFFEMGMDSLMSVELRNRIQDAIGNSTQLPTTFTFENPSIEKIKNALMNQLFHTTEKSNFETMDLEDIEKFIKE